MHAEVFLRALSIVLVVAAATTLLFHRLKQPVVLGYVLAGLIVGPHVPIPLVADPGVVQTLSELGVILLMYSLGLEFSLRKLAEVGPTAGLTAVIQCSLMAWLGYLAGRGLGWSPMDSVFTGAALAVSSTIIIVKAFEEQKVGGRLKDLVVGVLVVQDLISILAMAALTTVIQNGHFSPGALVQAGGRLLFFMAAALVLGLWLVPKGVRAVLKLNVPETTVVAAVGLGFLFALLAMEAGYSVALGAFMAGSLVAESGQGKRIEQLLQPLRDIFAAIFFVSVGMLLDPALAWEHWPAVLALSALTLVGKALSGAAGAMLTGNGLRTSVQAGLSLAQIGEFSFLLAALGLSLKATGPQLYPVIVAVSVLTTLSTPWLVRASGPIAEQIDQRLPKPLQTFSSLYASWAERLAASPDQAGLRAKAWSFGRLLLLDAGAILLVVTVAVSMEAELKDLLQGLFGWGPQAGRLLLLGLAFAAAAPFLLAIVRVSRGLGLLLAEAVFPAQADDQALDLALAPRRAMVAVIQFICLLLLGLPLLALTQPFFGSWQVGVLEGLILGWVAWGLWRHANDLQGHVRAGSELLAETLRQRLLAKAKVADPIDASLPDPTALPDFRSGLGDPVPVRLGEACPALGKSLGELRLRGSTGATVLAVLRADGSIQLANAACRLAPGDTIVLAGPRPAVDAARDLLKA